MAGFISLATFVFITHAVPAGAAIPPAEKLLPADTLTGEQKESNRQKSKIRARIEHVFGYMSQSMKGFYLRYIGRRRNAAAIGLINLIYNLARYEQIVRLKLLPRNAA